MSFNMLSWFCIIVEKINKMKRINITRQLLPEDKAVQRQIKIIINTVKIINKQKNHEHSI